MDALRLDQLKFPDETKAGLALMIVYILYDVTQSATFNGMQLAGWLGFEPNARVVGIVQLVMLGVVLIGLVLWRRRAASSKFGVRRLADVDPLLAADAAYLANHIGRGRGSSSSHPTLTMQMRSASLRDVRVGSFLVRDCEYCSASSASMYVPSWRMNAHTSTTVMWSTL